MACPIGFLEDKIIQETLFIVYKIKNILATQGGRESNTSSPKVMPNVSLLVTFVKVWNVSATNTLYQQPMVIPAYGPL